MIHARSFSSLPSQVFDSSIFFGTATASGRDSSLKINRDSLDRLILQPTRQAIQKLVHRRQNWDRRGSAAPSLTAVQRSVAFVEAFYLCAVAAEATIGREWIDPHVSSSEDGAVVLEWWRGSHKLTIYISETSADFLKVWGPDIESEMCDGPVVGHQFQGLWLWLNA